jgi:hypothetical protein
VTTIAYRDGVLAADTLITSGGDVIGQNTKIGGKNGVLWGASGDAAWGHAFRGWMRAGMVGEPPPIPDDATGATIFLPNGSVVALHARGFECRNGLPFWADGSGADYALGAMQHGATAEQAVRAAMAWDTRTGGEITVLKREET